MTDHPPFRARVRPELPPAAQRLVRAYEGTFGSTGPGCCPEALAAVLDELADEHAVISGVELRAMADSLRGAPWTNT